MRKFKNLVLGGVQQKMFNLVLYSIVLMIAAYTAIIFWQGSELRGLVDQTSVRQKEAITGTVERAMDELLTKNLGDTTQMEALLANDMFRDLTGAVTMMADYAERLYANPGSYPAREVALPDAATDGQTTVQLLTEAGVNPSDPAIARELALVGNMGDLLLSLYESSQVDSCYVALPSGVMVLVDNHASSKFAEDGSITPIEMTERPWYTGAVEKGGIYVTDVSADVFTGNVGVMCSMPVYNDGELVAVVGVDLLLNNMAESVANSANGEDFVCIVNDQGHVVFSPKDEGVFKVQESGQAADLRQSRGAIAGFVEEALKGVTAPTIVEADGRIYYMCGAPIQTVGWAVINVVSQQATDAVTEDLSREFDGVVDEALFDYRDSLSKSSTTMIVLLLAVMALALTGALCLAATACSAPSTRSLMPRQRTYCAT
ncbi:MAG: cache domain-containing protein [Atopobiaceae bacterium]|nr:cache domain-containing protein [Atopobiaceae bacterium]